MSPHSVNAMNEPASTPVATVAAPPLLPLAPFLAAIGDPLRWSILGELSAGDPLLVKEIAERLGRSPSLISKHLAVLRRGGVVVAGRGNFYQVPKAFPVDATARRIDFGHCELRFPPPSAN